MTVRELCRLAAAQYGLRSLRARVTPDNVASQKVLTKAGFLPAGPAAIGGKPATWYERDLAARLTLSRERPFTLRRGGEPNSRGQRIREPGWVRSPAQGDISVRADQRGRGRSDRAEHRKLHRPSQAGGELGHDVRR